MEPPRYLDEDSELLNKMKKIPSLRSLENEGIQALLRLSEIREFRAGEIIIEEGSYDEWIYYLISGKVKIVKNNKTLLTLQNTGDIFGEMGAIDGSERSASVYAVYDTSCIAIDISDLDQYAVKNKFAIRYIIYREFAEVLAHRLRHTTEELTKAKELLTEINLANRLIEKNQELNQAKDEIKKLRTKLLLTK